MLTLRKMAQGTAQAGTVLEQALQLGKQVAKSRSAAGGGPGFWLGAAMAGVPALVAGYFLMQKAKQKAINTAILAGGAGFATGLGFPTILSRAKDYLQHYIQNRASDVATANRTIPAAYLATRYY